ncbi:hypothetical protein BZA77DRAFT_6365 [Pyronema omphalodes]|nr:hypothetical protein BZA77DRAFT_6365 [Pyronema omphalodes]
MPSQKHIPKGAKGPTEGSKAASSRSQRRSECHSEASSTDHLKSHTNDYSEARSQTTGSVPPHNRSPNISFVDTPPPPFAAQSSSSRSSSQPPAKKRRIILLGAPTLDRIDTTTLLPLSSTFPDIARSCSQNPNWRILRPASARLETGFTQNVYDTQLHPSSITPLATQFPSATSTESGPVSPGLDEHSFFLATEHDRVPISSPGDTTADITVDVTTDTTLDDSALNDTMLDSYTTSQNSDRPPIPPLTSITDLEDLPSASEIEAAGPHKSLPVTLLVGILEVAEPRDVSTRFGVRQVLSFTLGDPTMAPFKLDIWIPAPNPQNIDDMELRAVSKDLRKGDVVVVKNCKLGMWKEEIFGTTGRDSKVWVMMRTKPKDWGERKRWRWKWSGGVGEDKVQRVVDWINGTIGEEDKKDEVLPAPTQWVDESF